MAKIIIVDDDVELAGNMAAALKKDGHAVITMDTTDGAVETIAKEKPDLAILDVMFPENPAGGFDLARQIRNTTGISKLPVLLLTAVNQEFPMDFSKDDIDEVWMPVQDFLEKPVTIATLKKKIKSLLHA